MLNAVEYFHLFNNINTCSQCRHVASHIFKGEEAPYITVHIVK